MPAISPRRLEAPLHDGAPKDATAADRVLMEAARIGQMTREAHLQLQHAHQQLAEEKREAYAMRRAQEQAELNAERVRTDAVKTAEAQREATERRLAKQLAVQRRMVEKDAALIQHRFEQARHGAAEERQDMAEQLSELQDQLDDARALQVCAPHSWRAA